MTTKSKEKTKEPIEIAFENFISESEAFFITKFITSETLKKMYCECLDIIYNITNTKDHGRGIIAFNPKYGQGKSFFFDVVNHRHRRRTGNFKFVRTTAKDLCELYKTAGKGEDPLKKLNKFIQVKNLFIDDIGDELKDGATSHHYSNKLNVVRHVLLKRYELWMTKGWRTYGTTNLSIEDIGKNYDGRVADRLLQMTYWKEFKFLTSGSFRQIESTRKLTQEEINESWSKLMVNKPIEKANLEKYFNDLIRSEDEVFRNFKLWTFARKFLIKKGILNDEIFDKRIDRNSLLRAGILLKREVKATTRDQMRHTRHFVRVSAVDRAIEAISEKSVRNYAENIVAREMLIELRKLKHKFE